MRQNIKIKGMSTTSKHEAGDAYNLVNMREKNGSLVPVAPREQHIEFYYRYDYVFMHQMAAFGIHYLGIRGGKLYYILHTAIAAPYDKELCSVGANVQITQIGNVLNITSDIGIQHAIWYENDYKVIDTNFDGAQTDSIIGPVKVDLKVDAHTIPSYPNNVVMNHFYGEFKEESRESYQTPSNIESRLKTTIGWIIRGISDAHSDGYLTGDFHLACTAIELYDGSYILHSTPVLLCPANDKENRYSNLLVGGVSMDYLSNQAVIRRNFKTVNYISAVDLGDYYSALYREDGSDDNPYFNRTNSSYLVKTTTASNFGMSYNIDLGASNGTSIQSYIYLNDLKFKINGNINPLLAPLVKSVSVFITSGVSSFDTEISNVKTISKVYNEYDIYNFIPKPKTNAEIIKELSENQIFYKVHEIPFDEIVDGGWTTIDLKGKLGENLINQERLPVDNFTHHSLRPIKQYVYNSRLHLLNYKTILSHGWPYEYFEQKEVGIGQFPTSLTSNYGDIYVYSEVKIKTENGTSIVVRNKTYFSKDKYSFVPMISYPDKRATDITLYIGNSEGNNKRTFKLIPSDSANFAYYISTDLKPISLPGFSGTPFVSFPPESQLELYYQSGLKVSEVNNPFTFPAANTYTIGNGRALNLASNAMQVSEGQFGQYPLYVFSEDGVYVLQIGTTVLYATQAPISTEQPISDKILSTPYGIVFITKKGLKMINGNKVDFIGAALEQKRDVVDFDKIDTVSLNGAFMANSEELSDYLASSSLKMAYNPHENEILLNKGGDYIFCFNLVTAQWYVSTEKWKNVVENGYPDLFVMKDTLVVAQQTTTLYDYEKETGAKTKCAFTLRPFDLGNDDYKRIERTWIRGQIMDGSNIFVMMHGGLDGRNMRAIKGFSYNKAVGVTQNNYKDIDLGMAAEKHKQFSISLAMECDSDTKIDSIELEGIKEYDNQKL